jgi:hypothetical protein
MKEVEFGGKRMDNGKWVYGYYFITPLTDESTGSKPEDGWFFLTGKERRCISKNNCVYEVDPETLCEYINYKDLNEEKLYTNDIIFYHRHEGWYMESKQINKLGVIIWDDLALGYRIKPIDIHSYKVNCGVDGEKIKTSHRIIKVGNIFDNNIKELVDKYLK